MTIQDLLLFSVFAILLVISPGPNGLLIARSVAITGCNRAYSNIAGFVCAFYFHGAISIFGLSAILLSSASAFLIFKMLGAAYLFYIGVKSLLSVLKPNNVEPNFSALKPNSNKVSKTVGFSEGFLTNVLNPKVSLFYLSAFPQFIAHSDAVVFWSFILISLHATLNAVWFLLVAKTVSRTKGMLTSNTFKQWLNGLTGALFIGFAVKLATTKID